MHRVLMIAFLLCGVPAMLQAQLGLEVSLNRQVYMQYEHIYAQVAIRNDSGRPLLFGKDPQLQGFILFEIRDFKGRLVPKVKDQEINVTGLVLGPGEVKRMILPLRKYYRLDTPGLYRVHTYISHNQLPHEYKSRDFFFRIDSGVAVWSRTVGIPDLTGKSKEPAQDRTYTIRSLTDRGATYYYLVIENSKQIFGVCQIGQKIGYEKFQAEVDMLSRIHLLMPISPRIFHYLSFSLEGQVTENSYWKNAESIPMLFRDSVTGKITRVGGVQARPGIDFRDPREGMMTASELLEEKKPQKPRAPKDGGRVDLGKGL